MRITDIASGRLNWDSVPYCKIKDVDFEKYKLKAGDIVIARTGATTGANYTFKKGDPDNVVYASYLIKYSINQEIANPYFVGYVLKSNNWSEYVDAIAGGSAQPGANAKQLGCFEIQLPPLPEQKAIADVLSSLDDKIDLLHQQNETLEALAETLFRQWFVEEAKEDWEESDIYEFIDVIYGFPFKSKFFNEEQKGYPLVRIRNLKDGYSNVFTEEGCEEKHFLNNGDLVAGMDGEFRLYIWKGVKSVLNQRACKFVPKNDTIPPFYVYSLIKPHLEYYEYVKVGTTVIHLGKSDIDEIRIKIPTKDLLKKYGEITNPLFEKYKNNSDSIRTLTSLRDTLLPKLMSGEVRVKN